MDKNTFWKLIEKTNAKDTDTHYINLLKEIKNLSLEDAVKFGYILSLYTEYSQSTASYIACRLINGSASDDTELYFRLWLISKGKKIFFGTLKNPDTLAGIKTAEEGVEFEMLMSVVYTALDDMTDNAEEAIEKYALTEEERNDIINEIERDENFPESEEALWEEAKIRAPKLYKKYHRRVERFDEETGIPEGGIFNEGDSESKEVADKILAEFYSKHNLEPDYIPLSPEENKKRKEEMELREHQKLAEEAKDTKEGYIIIGGLFGGLQMIITANAKIGFTDKSGNIVIAPEYELVGGDFSSSLCPVRKNRKWGYINKKGEAVVPLIYDEVADMFEGGYAAVKKNGLWGAIDKKGNIAIECKYENSFSFYEGFACVGLNGKYAILDTKGNLMTDFVYDGPGMFHNGRAIVRKKDKDGLLKEGLLDENCREIVPPIYDQIEGFFVYGYSLVCTKEIDGSGKEKYKTGFIDRSGNVIVPIIYDNMRRFERNPKKAIGILGEKEVPIDMSPFVIEKTRKKM